MRILRIAATVSITIIAEAEGAKGGCREIRHVGKGPR